MGSEFPPLVLAEFYSLIAFQRCVPGFWHGFCRLSAHGMVILLHQGFWAALCCVVVFLPTPETGGWKRCDHLWFGRLPLPLRRGPLPDSARLVLVSLCCCYGLCFKSLQSSNFPPDFPPRLTNGDRPCTLKCIPHFHISRWFKTATFRCPKWGKGDIVGT